MSIDTATSTVPDYISSQVVIYQKAVIFLK